MSRKLQRAVISKTWAGKFVSVRTPWSSRQGVALLLPKSSGDSFLPPSPLCLVLVAPGRWGVVGDGILCWCDYSRSQESMC